jgi:hypothetical protein
MKAHQGPYPVSEMCRALHVSRSGYYGWRAAAHRPRARSNAQLDAEIRHVYQSHLGRYGSPRVTRVLQSRAIACSENRVARRMRALGLAARPKKAFVPRTTDSRHDGAVSANLLLHRPEPRAAHEVWLSDITYIATGQGWLYLAGFLDLATRRLVDGRRDQPWPPLWFARACAPPGNDAVPARASSSTATRAASMPVTLTGSCSAKSAPCRA